MINPSKMQLKFDIHGYLTPYEKIELDKANFKAHFVEAFEATSSRYTLFEKYEAYTAAFQEQVTPKFTQWINGSFVSNKPNPNDIDLVLLVEHSIVEAKENIIRKQFLGANVKQEFGIDAYLLILYPESHNLQAWTTSDLLYWQDWFSKSKMNRRKKRYPKGFVAINFE